MVAASQVHFAPRQNGAAAPGVAYVHFASPDEAVNVHAHFDVRTPPPPFFSLGALIHSSLRRQEAD